MENSDFQDKNEDELNQKMVDIVSELRERCYQKGLNHEAMPFSIDNEDAFIRFFTDKNEEQAVTEFVLLLLNTLKTAYAEGFIQNENAPSTTRDGERANSVYEQKISKSSITS